MKFEHGQKKSVATAFIKQSLFGLKEKERDAAFEGLATFCTLTRG